jgi:predicted Fe-Mo cluster-binding NifX family protein
MRLGMPVWNGRVSPVLDTASRLLIFDTEAPEDAAPEEVPLPLHALPVRAGIISRLGLDLVVCGAISRSFEDLLVAAGVELRPWIAGEVEDVLEAAASGRLGRPRFRMPGCRSCGRRRARGRGRPARGRTMRSGE